MCSTSLGNREMQSKTALRWYHFTSVTGCHQKKKDILFFEAGSLAESGDGQLARLSGHRVPRICLSPCSQHCDYRHATPHSAIYMYAGDPNSGLYGYMANIY